MGYGLVNMCSLNGKYIDAFYSYSLVLLFFVSLFVLYLICSYFYTHLFYTDCLDSSKLEYYWTIVPGCILFLLSFPSLVSLYYQDKLGQYSGGTMHVVGNQWFWEYCDLHSSFSSYLKTEGLESLRNLTASTSMFLQTQIVTRFLCTSNDVIHSLSIPDLGLKLDCVKGRISVGYVLPLFEGTYYGQCSEICGLNHPYMPISAVVTPLSCVI